MRVSDLFNTTEEDLFGITIPTLKNLKTDIVNQITRGPILDVEDIDMLKLLTQLVQDDFIAYGTSGSLRLKDDEVRVCVRAVRVLLKRTEIGELNLPFKDFSGFNDYWHKEGMVGGGSWAKRRSYIQSLFQPILDNIDDRLDEEFTTTLSEPIAKPASLKSWADIEVEIAQLRQRFASAKTPQDFSSVGTACARIINEISRVAYKHNVHSSVQMDSEPPIEKTDIRIARVIEVGLGGRKNEQLRNLSRASSAAAHRVKHGRTPTKLQAGIACDATILLASIIQRIEVSRSEASIYVNGINANEVASGAEVGRHD